MSAWVWWNYMWYWWEDHHGLCAWRLLYKLSSVYGTVICCTAWCNAIGFLTSLMQVYLRCIQWPQRTNFTAPGCIHKYQSESCISCNYLKVLWVDLPLPTTIYSYCVRGLADKCGSNTTSVTGVARTPLQWSVHKWTPSDRFVSLCCFWRHLHLCVFLS